jgi:hypothetical protein
MAGMKWEPPELTPEQKAEADARMQAFIDSLPKVQVTITGTYIDLRSERIKDETEYLRKHQNN